MLIQVCVSCWSLFWYRIFQDPLWLQVFKGEQQNLSLPSLPQRDSGRTKEDNNHERALHIQKLSPMKMNQIKTARKSPIYCSINPPASAGDAGLIPGQKDPLKKKMATHSRIHSWRIHGQRSLAGLPSRGCKESDTAELTLHSNLAVSKPGELLLSIFERLKSKLGDGNILEDVFEAKLD